jgi:hypothetical protein
VPRETRHPSIEFDGLCIHAQVVNYAMWGEMNQLCGQNAAASAKHFAWTHARKEIGGPGYGGAHYDEQVLMRELGQAFARTAATEPGADNTYKSSSYEDQLAYGRAKDSLAAKMGKIKRDEEPCELKCQLTADEQGQIGKWQLDWHWADYHVLKDGTVKVFKLPPGFSNAPAKSPRR